MTSLLHLLLRRRHHHHHNLLHPSTLLRALSTLPRRGVRPSPSPHHRPSVDIGARARRLQARRLWSYGLAFSCVAGLVVTGLSTFQDALVFYVTPSEALERFAADPSLSRFRLGGLVLEGSISHPPGGAATMEFVVTDLLADVLVRYDGVSLPDLFREGHSVVVEGTFKKVDKKDEVVVVEGRGKVTEKARGVGYYFEATEVLAKHDEKYMPKEVGEALERNRRKIAAEAAAAAENRKE